MCVFLCVCVCVCVCLYLYLCVIGTSMEKERFFRWKQCSLSVCGQISSYCLLVGWLVCQQAIHSALKLLNGFPQNLGGWRVLICSWSLSLCLLLTSIWSQIQLAAASGYLSNKATYSLGNSVNDRGFRQSGQRTLEENLPDPRNTPLQRLLSDRLS